MSFSVAGRIAPVCMGVVLLASPVAAQELRTINVMSPNDTSCGPYPQIVSDEFGFFAEEGLQVNLLSSNTAVPFVAFLSNGDADIASFDAGQVLQAAATDQPIAVVYEAYQYASEGIAVAAESPVQDIAELRDQTIGMATDRDLITTAIALNSAGLEIGDVTTVVVGDSGPVLARALRDNTIQAFSGGNTDRVGIEAAGLEIRNITPVEVSQVPGNSWTAWKPTLEEKRPLIQAFLRAWAKGQQAGVLDTRAVMAACRKRIPEQWEQPGAGERLLNYSIYFTQLRRTMKLGEIQTDVWEGIQEPYVALGEIPARIDPATFLDTSFIDEANNFTTEAVKSAIARWKEANPEIRAP